MESKKIKKIRKKELVDFIDNYLVKNLKEMQQINKGSRKAVFHSMVEDLIDYIKNGLKNAHPVEIRGLGSLKKILRKGKKGRKVRTGEPVDFPDYFDVKLKIAKGFKKLLNDNKKG